MTAFVVVTTALFILVTVSHVWDMCGDEPEEEKPSRAAEFFPFLVYGGLAVWGLIALTGCTHNSRRCNTEACQLAARVMDEPRRRAEAAQAQQESVDAIRHAQAGSQ